VDISNAVAAFILIRYQVAVAIVSIFCQLTGMFAAIGYFLKDEPFIIAV
jgi:hypothetical protein